MSEKEVVMEIPWDAEARLISRPNRFLGVVDIASYSGSPSKIREEKVHIHDPGRLEDLLYPGNELLLKKASNPNRKTGWDVIAAKADDGWILINSAFHRKIAEWAIENEVSPFLEGLDSVAAEQKFGDSRLDFLLVKDETKIWVEVKGCTLINGNKAIFPDAPTVRGKRHIEELIKAVRGDDEALLVVLVFRPDAKCFAPNEIIDPDLAEVFREAVKEGVNVCPMLFSYEGQEIIYRALIPLCDGWG
ncbi:DNA/RNA nuclease SfsA [Methanococcoides methylutens]|uniref:Sugar fermentation stimulation protein homolog n=1 Tax=Methanococcoides methylutens MM1 TaxID=1434104 RepID=A0A0E3WZJ0_METMT|nr:DNA/RNA nuclease SfsA [Methanococcoides methylutens]AKB84785.1 putative DNA-binding transcriptional regulator [Methanococcoides methylutens MM1]